MEGSGNMALVNYPTTWIKQDFERFKQKGKPSGSNTRPSTRTYTTVPTTITINTMPAEKQQKTDDNKLQAWS